MDSGNGLNVTTYAIAVVSDQQGTFQSAQIVSSDGDQWNPTTEQQLQDWSKQLTKPKAFAGNR